MLNSKLHRIQGTINRKYSDRSIAKETELKKKKHQCVLGSNFFLGTQ